MNTMLVEKQSPIGTETGPIVLMNYYGDRRHLAGPGRVNGRLRFLCASMMYGYPVPLDTIMRKQAGFAYRDPESVPMCEKCAKLAGKPGVRVMEWEDFR